ncbi:MAG: type IV pili twitching motility protein PilT, partial [Deltaproteobacteria bacterium]
ISVFPPYQQKQVRMQLGSVLRAVISQRLVPKADGRGRVAAVEVLISTTRVREMVEDKDRTKEIPDAIAQGHQTYGMQTFDQSLMNLMKQQVITYDEALRQTTNRDDFALRVSGISATSDSKWDDFEGKAPAAPAAPPPPAAAAPRPGTLPPRPAAAPAPAAPKPQGADDDFQIERF